MKHFLHALICAALAAGGALAQDKATGPAVTKTNTLTEAPLRQALVFGNGDLLYGRLLSIDPKNGVRWQHPDVNEPVQFKMDNLAEIQLGHQQSPENSALYPCIVHLSNDDEMEGNLVTLDANQLVLETWYAGKVVIPRARVRVIVPVPTNLRMLYNGPSGLEGWTQAKVTAPMNDVGEWYFRNGAFYATRAASIARDLKLPGMASIEFDLTWRGTLNVAVAIYTDSMQPISLRSKETEPDFAGFYSLQMNTYSVNLLMVNKADPLKNLGQVIVPTFSQKNNAHIALKVNKEERSITLLIDDVIVKQWIDDQKFGGEGSGMRFVHQGQGAIKLSNLRITQWDGRFEEKLPANASAQTDLALLLNRDKVAGSLRGIREGKVTFAIPESTLDVPIQRVTQILLAGNNAEPVRKLPESLRAYFERRGNLTFQLQSWDQKRVVGISPIFGRFEADPRAFDRIQFNLDN